MSDGGSAGVVQKNFCVVCDDRLKLRSDGVFADDSQRNWRGVCRCDVIVLYCITVVIVGVSDAVCAAHNVGLTFGDAVIGVY